MCHGEFPALKGSSYADPGDMQHAALLPAVYQGIGMSKTGDDIGATGHDYR